LNLKGATERKHRNQEYVNGVKSNPCADCGRKFHFCQMDFDHVDMASKKHQISRLLAYDMEVVKAEIAKCRLICANCHADRTQCSLHLVPKPRVVPGGRHPTVIDSGFLPGEPGKRCAGCEKLKPLSCFSKQRGGRRARCRKCLSEQKSAWRQDHRQQLREERVTKQQAIVTWANGVKDGQPCLDCGESFRYWKLDWDHRDGELKVDTISVMKWKYPKKLIEAEMVKCDLVCRCCHRLRTWHRQSRENRGAA